MEFTQFNNDIKDIWLYKISASFSKINNRVFNHCGKKLKTPNFFINKDTKTKWGHWSPSNRELMLSSRLLNGFEWKAVEFVLAHEMAHQIVSEIFDMDCYSVSHGEAWKRACDMVEIEPKRCCSVDFLSDFKGIEESPVADKVRKLMNHASDQGATEKEAESFMNKAREIMIRHNMEMKDVLGETKAFLKRPVGNMFKRWPAWMSGVAHLLSTHYNVNTIRTYTYKDGEPHYYLELFGEPSNVDIAEYVGHALITQSENLYKEFKKQPSNSYRKRTKKAFVGGLIAGYTQKLDKTEQASIEKIESEDGCIVPAFNKKLLNEMFGKAYPRVRSIATHGSRGAGRSAGIEQGRKLTLSKGVRAGSSTAGLLS